MRLLRTLAAAALLAPAAHADTPDPPPVVAVVPDPPPVLRPVPVLPKSAPGVAAPVPFDPSRCGPEGCPSTPTTTAPAAGGRPSSPAPAGTRSSAPDPFGGPTSTGAGLIRLTGGTTSGCASGNCPAPSAGYAAQRRGLFGLRR